MDFSTTDTIMIIKTSECSKDGRDTLKSDATAANCEVILIKLQALYITNQTTLQAHSYKWRGLCFCSCKRFFMTSMLKWAQLN